MSYIRFGHILPLESDCFTLAIKRGLVNTLPPYMLSEDPGLPYVRGASSWLRVKFASGSFQRPRFFLPYVEEAKSCLEERLGRPGEMIPNRSNRGISQIPDALYMIDKASNANMEFYSNIYEGLNEKRNANSIAQLPIIEQRILMLMKQREQELKARALGYRALALVSSRNEVATFIQLRVVREFGLPDAAIDVLSSEPQYISYHVSESDPQPPIRSSDDVTTSYEISNYITNSNLIRNSGSITPEVADKNPYGYTNEIRYETAIATDSYLSSYNFEAEVCV